MFDRSSASKALRSLMNEYGAALWEPAEDGAALIAPHSYTSGDRGQRLLITKEQLARRAELLKEKR